MTSDVRQAPEITSGDLGGEIVLLGIKQGKYYGLNKVASRIWQLLERPVRVASLVDSLVAEYDVDRDRCQAETFALLDSLATRGLVLCDPPASE